MILAKPKSNCCHRIKINLLNWKLSIFMLSCESFTRVFFKTPLPQRRSLCSITRSWTLCLWKLFFKKKTKITVLYVYINVNFNLKKIYNNKCILLFKCIVLVKLTKLCAFWIIKLQIVFVVLNMIQETNCKQYISKFRSLTSIEMATK